VSQIRIRCFLLRDGVCTLRKWMRTSNAESSASKDQLTLTIQRQLRSFDNRQTAQTETKDKMH